MQIVILAGGLGTRIGPLAEHIPKSLLEVCGRPFIQYQLEWLVSFGIRNVVICVGHQATLIKEFVEDGNRFGLNIKYSHENDKLLGTAGAVKNAEVLLADEFCVLNGDSYLPISPLEPIKYFRQNECAGLMTTFCNHGEYDKSNLIVDKGMVVVYDREKNTPGLDSIDYGLQIFKKEVLGLIPPNTFLNMDVLYQILVRQKQLAAFEVEAPFYEVGSIQGIARFRQYIEQGRLCRR